MLGSEIFLKLIKDNYFNTDFRVAFNRHSDIRIDGEFKEKPIPNLHHLTN